MGAHRRLFSRRSIVGLVVGIVLGFNLASWIAVPVPSHTDIEIELIANARGVGNRVDYQQFRLGVARVRRNNKIAIAKAGKDCDHEVIDYGDESVRDIAARRKDQESALDLQRNKVPLEEAETEIQDFEDGFDEFDLEEERRKRQKELEKFYESDKTEDEGELEDEDEMLENFQYPVNVKKYVDYELEMTSQIAKRKKHPGKNSESKRRAFDELKASPENKVKIVHDRKHFVYIGVLTAQKYLQTRGRAIMDTWAKKVPGTVEFYVGEGVENVNDGEPPLPLVKLKTVKDDAYPPQKKSFLLLKTMHDIYLNSGYQWFVRADDDAYIKTEKLEKFLRNLNSSEPIFLGQTGLGNAEERGRLNLPHGDNYCMGGPGMIFSREVLRRVGPHIRSCVRRLYSWHEDVEISRCIRRYADVNCAWSYQMQELFYEHYTLRKGYIDPYDDPNNLKLYSAMTLHPNKKPQYQIKLHKFMQSLHLQHLQNHIKLRSRDIVRMDNYLEEDSTMEDYMLGIEPSLNRIPLRNRSEVRPWEFMTDRLWYSAPPLQARKSITHDKHIAVKHLVMRIMQSMNTNSKSRGRIIEFKQVAYGYHRVNPLYGAEYVLDLLLLYKRFRGKPLSIPVRRHAYLQQTFAKTLMHEDSPIDVQALFSAIKKFKPGLMHSVLNSLRKKSLSAMKAVGLSFAKENEKSLVSSQDIASQSDSKASKVLRFDTGNFAAFSNAKSSADIQTVNIIIPLKGRYETFRTFMSSFEKVCLLQNDPVTLLIILFTSKDPLEAEDDRRTIELLNNYAKIYPHYELRLIPINGTFSRGLGLQIGASHFSSKSLLFFCDIDVVFDTSFTRKCRANAVNGSRVYYPVLFSQFHPNFDHSWSLKDHLLDPLINFQKLQNSSSLQRDRNDFEVNHSRGYWRNYGFGLLCTYKSDFLASGGFDISIQGWGMEDVDLVDKFITGRAASDQKELRERKSSTLNKINIFRSFDPSLVHVYHPSNCDVKLAENQLRMCRASRASGLSSILTLARAWKEVQKHSNRTSFARVVDPVSEILPAELDVEQKLEFRMRNVDRYRDSNSIRKKGRKSIKAEKSFSNRRRNI